MNKNIFLAAAVVAASFVFTSCSDDEEPLLPPEISDFELGISNSQIGYVGSDVHMQAEVVAASKISTIEVEIHPEGGGSGWEYEHEYTEFSGLRNTSFHKHIDIPAGTEPGDYHFHFVVTDLAGNQSEIERDLSIQLLDDEVPPVITVSSAPEAGQTFANGETISISGTITDNIALAGTLIALVRKDDNLPNSAVTGSNPSVIVMLHTHDFETPESFAFEASMTVGAEYDNNMVPAPIEGDNAWASGEYYLLIKCKDAMSNGMVSAKYPLTISL